MNNHQNFIFLLIFALLSCGGPQDQPGPEEDTGKGNDFFVVSQGDSLYVKSIGSGPPILCIHGGPGLNHDYFLPHLSELSDEYRLIFYDQRLSGKSSGQVDTSTISLDGFLMDIETIRTHLGLESWSILGHSWGGLLAMQYSINYEERVRDLILIGSAPTSTELQDAINQEIQGRETLELKSKREQIVQSSSFRNGSVTAFDSLFHVIFGAQFYDSRMADSLFLNLPQDFAQRTRRLSPLSRDFSEYDLHDDLMDLNVPVLILYGEMDPAANISGPDLARYLPDSDLIIIENAGHFPFIEAKKAFFHSVSTFLNAQPEM